MEEQKIPAQEEELQQLETPEVQEPGPKNRKRTVKRVLYYLLLAVFVGTFIYCAITIVNYMVGSNQVSGAYGDLSDLRDQYMTQNTEPEHTLPQGVVPTLPDGEKDPQYILPELQELYNQNQDLVGWIKIPGTNVDYPVVQTPSNPNYYLRRGFDKKYSTWGCLYVREKCNVYTPSDNVVIYGHRMRDGTMFAQLLKYKEEEFWKEHQTFSFDTLYERHTYQIIAVFKTSANIGQGFAYHTFNDAKSQEEFDQFIQTVHELAPYDTGITAQYGDMLLTLSTCDYSLDNGRFVVVAKRIS